jgi:D-alanyl-D-alanine carboxypeptidase/D-alanyl-D-alanine-endopeptidase (penicillin-binding protein 4)
MQPDARAEARLAEALAGSHSVSMARSWGEVRTLAGSGALDAFVVDADFPHRGEALAEIGLLRKNHPDLALVTYADVHDSDPELVRLGALGVHGVLVAGRPPWASGIRKAVERALAAARAGKVACALEGRFPEKTVAVVSWAVEHAQDDPSVARYAAANGLSPRGLATLLRASELPPPGRLLMWGRLLQAGAFLARDRRTVEATAHRLGYATAGALARAMKRETGRTPAEVARRGGLAYVHGRLFGTHGGLRDRSVRRTMLLAALLLQTACATLGGGPPAARGVDAILDAAPVDQVSFGVLAVDAASGRTLYARNERRKFVPASNQKVLVTAAALSLLGADYRFRTGVWGTGPVENGTLHGDLVLPAQGDPTLSGRYWASGEAALRALADSLRGAGVRRVAGALVVDVSGWDSASVGPTWEVEDLRYAYASTGGAFAMDEGEVRVVVRGAPTAGGAAEVSWSPLGDPDFVVSRVVTAHPDSSTRVRADYLPESRRLVLEGRVGASRADTVSFAVRDPVRQAARSLERAFEERGVALAAGAWVAWDRGVSLAGGCTTGTVQACPGARRLAGLTSPPLAEILSGILEPSQNWMTEQLVRALGAERGQRGGWAEGAEVVRRFLVADVGVDSLDVAPRDGSGLSAYNLVTPRALVAVLRHMAAGPHAGTYRRALAEPGEEDSTLERRLAGFEGRVFAKTGTISNVNSLSGYLVGYGGREVVFSILSNGSGLPSARVRVALDDVVRALAEVRR